MSRDEGRAGQVTEDGTRGRVLTVGMFDGVHLGHQQLLRRTDEEARRRATEATALTFQPHPRSVLSGREDTVPFLTGLEERLRLIVAEGIASPVVLPFDGKLAQLSAYDFFTHLTETLPFEVLVVGENFRAGRGREAGIPELAEIGRQLGWSVQPVPAVRVAGDPVSSTRIRRVLIEEGDVDLAARLLGRAFAVEGRVVPGAGRGRTIGVPTANIGVPEGRVIPRNGVYYCLAAGGVLPPQGVPGVLNVGIRPTFGVGTRSVELHLPGWSGDLYGQQLRVEFLARLRDERRFEDASSLVAQIRLDISRARELEAARSD